MNPPPGNQISFQLIPTHPYEEGTQEELEAWVQRIHQRVREVDRRRIPLYERAISLAVGRGDKLGRATAAAQLKELRDRLAQV